MSRRSICSQVLHAEISNSVQSMMNHTFMQKTQSSQQMWNDSSGPFSRVKKSGKLLRDMTLVQIDFTMIARKAPRGDQDTHDAAQPTNVLHFELSGWSSGLFENMISRRVLHKPYKSFDTTPAQETSLRYVSVPTLGVTLDSSKLKSQKW